MIVILGASLFIIIALMTILVACGLPLGEFTMGGQYQVLPKKLRFMAIISVVIQLFASITILQAGGFIDMWFSYQVTKYITMFFAIYLSLNTVMNFLSNSKKEKYVMTPTSFITAMCFWITALTM